MKVIIKTTIVLYLIIIIGAILYGFGAYDYFKYKLTDNDVNMPKELYICFSELDNWYGETKRAQFKSANDDELYALPNEMGLYIRNYWIRNDGLNINLEEKLTEAGLKSPEEMSGLIIKSYHRYLNKKDIRFFQQVKDIEDMNEFWVSYLDIASGVLYFTIIQVLVLFMLLGWSKFNKKIIYRFIFIESSLIWIFFVYDSTIDYRNDVNDVIYVIGSISGILFIINTLLLFISIFFVARNFTKKYIYRMIYVKMVISFLMIIMLVTSMFKQEKSIQDAYNFLAKAEVFSCDPISDGGFMSEEIKAYIKLFNSQNAKDLFKQLEGEGTIEGKLFALCALYYLDNTYYNKVIEKYILSDKMATEQYGCFRSELKVNEIIKKNEENVVRLSNEKDTISKWLERNNLSEFGVDFYGGGIPYELKDYIENGK